MKVKILSIKPAKNPKARFIALTGTPVTESPLNAYSLARLIQPELACSKQKFDAFFVETEVKFFGGARINKVKGYKNLDKLKELLASFAIRRITAEGMPEKIWTERIVELSSAQKAAYNALAKSAKREIESEGFNQEQAENKTLKLRQFLNHPSILGMDEESAKLDAVEEIADEILEDPQAKLLIWTFFLPAIPKYVERLKRYNPKVVEGATPDSELKRLQKTFDHSNERIIIASLSKASTGIDWFARARHAIYVDLPYSAVMFNQSQDRLRRRVDLTSKDEIEMIKARPAILIKLKVPGSVDSAIIATLDRKQKLSDAATSIRIDDIKLSQEELMDALAPLE